MCGACTRGVAAARGDDHGIAVGVGGGFRVAVKESKSGMLHAAQHRSAHEHGRTEHGGARCSEAVARSTGVAQRV